MSQLIGRYDTIAAEFVKNTPCKDPFMQVFQSDFGFLRDDGIMVISPKDTLTNGASLPRIFWPILGTPLEMPNCLWAANHDSAYKGTVIVINCKRLLVTMSPKRILKCWRELKGDWFIHRDDLGRKWFDQNMVQVMKCVKESSLKQKMAYAGVRVGGWASWKKNLTSK